MYVAPEVDEAINTRILPLLQPNWAPHNAILWNGYRSIDFPGEELQLFVHGIYLDWSFEQAGDYIRNWSASRAYARDGGERLLDKALAEIARLWGPASRQVVMPLHLRVARLDT